MDSNKDNQSAETSPEKATSAAGPNYFLLFVQLLVSPNSGWRRIKGVKADPARFATNIFYRLLALMAIARFCVLIPKPDTSVALILQHAVIAFVSFFGSYFGSYALCCAVLPPVARDKMRTPYGKVLVAAGFSVLALGYTLSLIAPHLEALLWLGALYSLYIICRGVKFLHVPHSDSVATCTVICAFNIIMPAAIGWLLSSLMPAV